MTSFSTNLFSCYFCRGSYGSLNSRPVDIIGLLMQQLAIITEEKLWMFGWEHGLLSFRKVEFSKHWLVRAMINQVLVKV